MGFNLEMFFNDLLEILDSDMNDSEKANKLKHAIYFEYDHAISCGLIKQTIKEKNHGTT